MALQERKLPFGKIEPNSFKYFYSCGLGGIIGMSPFPSILRSTSLTNISPQLVVSKSIHITNNNTNNTDTRCRTYPHSCNTSRPRQMPTPSRSQDLHLQSTSMALNLLEGRSPRRLLRLVPNIPGVFIPRRRQVWFIRVLQVPLRRPDVPPDKPHPRLPGRQCLCGVLC